MAEYIKKEDILKVIAEAYEETIEYSSATTFGIAILNGFTKLQSYVNHNATVIIAPPPQTICGYHTEKIIAFARMCEEMGVTDQDLKSLCHNVQFAWDAVNRDMEIQFARMIDSLCTDKYKIEPEALKGKDDGIQDNNHE